MPPILKSKLPHAGPSIFTVMSELAQRHEAINLSQGFPDFPADPALLERVQYHMAAGHNQYAPLPGIPALREELSRWIAQKHGHQYDPDTEVTITHGATEAIAAALACSVREGDEVIIFTPAYDCYAPLVELHGGTPIFVQLQHPDYSIDWDTLKNRLNHRTRMIVINTPHNPTSTLLSREDLQHLAELTDGSNILILSDEVYEEIVFAPHRHHSVADIPTLAERSFRIGSLGKILHVTGWKIGYCMAPEALTTELRRIHQYLVFCANAPLQYAIADYLQGEMRDLAGLFRQKCDVFLEAVAGSKFKPLPALGSYFQLLDYSAVSEQSDVEFARELTEKHRVASIPISVFYHQPRDHKVLRFCIAKEEGTLRQAGAILSEL